MTDTVGRNDPCPCGSGKKFKHCCRKRIQQADGMPWRTFPEEFVVGQLLRGSDEFVAFYEAERDKVREPLHWAEDPNLRDGIDYQASRLRPGLTLVIRLRRVPPPLHDASKVAHELEHYVLDSKGYPIVGSSQSFKALAAPLADMMADPIVNLRLSQFDFNLQEVFDEELKQARRRLAHHRQAPSDRLNRLKWVFLYVGTVLEWKSIHGELKGERIQFQTWFDGRYPDLAQKASSLLALVERLDYHTPSDQQRVLRRIVHKYGLKELVSIRIPSTSRH